MKTFITFIKTIFSNRKIRLVAAVTLVLLVVLAVKIITTALHPAVIAFYGLEQSTQTKLQASLETLLKDKKVSFEFIVFDNNQTLSSQITKGPEPAIVITTSGAPVTTAVNNSSSKSQISQELLNNMTTSMKNSGLFDEKTNSLKALPVLLSNTEIAIDTAAFKQSRMNSISTWDDIKTFNRIQKKYNDYPVAFAAKEYDLYLDLLGALTEAFEGTESYTRAAEILKNENKKFNATAIVNSLCNSENAPLKSSVEYLSTLYKDKLLNPNCFNYQNADILSLMKARIAPTVFMTFDAHRTVDSNTIKHFSTIYLPSDKSPSERAFTAPVIYAVKMQKSSPLDFIFEELVKNETQEQLSRDTGLAPVLAKCRTPDHQADDVRYWMAATNPPLAGLSREADLTLHQKKQICDLITTKIIEK